jgi:hypothetical protein
MSAQAFRQRRRASGVFIPIEEVSAHLACGWRVAEDVATSAPHELLMAPPDICVVVVPSARAKVA